MTLKFAEKFDDLFLHVFVSDNIFPVRHCFVAVLVTRSNNFVSLHLLDRNKLVHVSLIQLVTGIATKPWLGRHILKYKKMRKWMIKFCRKFGNHGIKIFWVNSILIKKSINLWLFALIFYSVWVCCDRRQFSMHCPFIEKSMLEKINFWNVIFFVVQFII